MDKRDNASLRRLPNLDVYRQVVRLTDPETEEFVEIPYDNKVCPSCEGRGSYVSPGVDAHGITQSEMAELGHAFREDYSTGRYDVECGECKGRRVVPDLRPRTDAQRRAVDAHYDDIEDRVSDQRTRMREMGVWY